MKQRLAVVGILLSAWIVACGGDDKGSSTSSSGGSSSGTTSSSGDPQTGSSGGDADAGTTPKAVGPKITSIMKMTGGLHVTWELPDSCDGVELERKEGTGDFAVKYKLPGTVDNKHDGTATKGTVYTYRARCRSGADYTEYSNEMSKNPI